MRLVIARCSVDYVGRLTAHLPSAQRLILVKADGSALTRRSVFRRYLALGVSLLTGTVGFWMSAFDPEKRALHDRICATRVVREDDDLTAPYTVVDWIGEWTKQ